MLPSRPQPPPWRDGDMPSKRPSGRRHRGDAHRELDLERATGGRSATTRQGEEWTVQKVRGNEKTYRCPGCQQEIAAWTPHVVTWAQDSLFGTEAALAARRHWHSSCWDRG